MGESYHRINRNIVECKGRKVITWKRRKAVLIETLWNVKSSVCGCFWTECSCINRNIVECKADTGIGVNMSVTVLIDVADFSVCHFMSKGKHLFTSKQ